MEETLPHQPSDGSEVFPQVSDSSSFSSSESVPDESLFEMLSLPTVDFLEDGDVEDIESLLTDLGIEDDPMLPIPSWETTASPPPGDDNESFYIIGDTEDDVISIREKGEDYPVPPTETTTSPPNESLLKDLDIQDDPILPIPPWETKTTTPSDDIESFYIISDIEDDVISIKEKGKDYPSPPPPEMTASPPNERDVLCGKEANTRKHRGNENFRALVRQNYRDYDALGKRRLEKTRLTKKIIEEIEQSGGRFLEKTQAGHWVEADRDFVLNKVANALRSEKRKKGGNKQQRESIRAACERSLESSVSRLYKRQRDLLKTMAMTRKGS